eukprot:TRINITY_DN8187_c0_g1_i8.p2 TRINITY_DN8187_c0_g1~~TRINITY_DN8187_c0_g1_i8.p2  ORF type:complete len:224 (-),score=48.30 TRINITY_DN8187_c0_g1_i8:155-826(-)
MTKINQIQTENDQLRAIIRRQNDKIAALSKVIKYTNEKIVELSQLNQHLQMEVKELEHKLSDLRKNIDSDKILGDSSILQKFFLTKHLRSRPHSSNSENLKLNWLKYNILSSLTKKTIDFTSVSSDNLRADEDSGLFIATEEETGLEFGQYVSSGEEAESFAFSLSASSECAKAEAESAAEIPIPNTRSCFKIIKNDPKEFYTNLNKIKLSSLQHYKVNVNSQ